jgi:uncharacterized repeat protein (TIGR03803 family)
MRKLVASLGCLLLTMVSLAHAQGSNPTISQLFAFSCNADFTSCPYGIEPTLSPIQLADGNLYGVTWWAGQNNPNAGGTVWKITTAGKASVVHTFEPDLKDKFPRGENPVVGFVQGSDHNLYGVTEQGGTTNQGVLYKLLPTGKFQILHDFCTGKCTNSQGPIILGSDGNFYGVQVGGEVIFRFTPLGAYSVVHTLNPDTEGRASVMIRGQDGNFYGTGAIGSACQEHGIVFKLTPSGTFTTLATFGDLELASDTLVQASNGNFYGSVAGTIFQMTPSGTVSTIYTLKGEDGLTVVQIQQASDGNLWVLTGDGGPQPARPGEVFAVTLQGSEVASAAFTCATNGCSPAGMIQGTDGSFYGVAEQGGSAAGQSPLGTLFKIDAGLAPPAQ